MARMSGRPQIALIGFMGSGKTTVGALLALELGYTFLDLDHALAERAGMSIPEIFAREGEAGFRRRERSLLLELGDQPGRVLATGGGIVLEPENVAFLRRHGLVVALTADLPEILARIGGGEGRPLLRGPDPMSAAAALWSAREPLYRGAADLIVDTKGLAPPEVARKIADWYRMARREDGSGA